MLLIVIGSNHHSEGYFIRAECFNFLDYHYFIDLTKQTFTILYLNSLSSFIFNFVWFYQGGMDSQLFTCCGSPAYAAPELVSGREYLGSEVRLIKNLNITIYFFFSSSIWSWLYIVNEVSSR